MKEKVSSIASALGNVQHMRSKPAAASLPPRVPESLNTQIPAGPDTREPLPLQGTAKRTHPDFVQLKAYVRKQTKRDAMRKAEDDGHDDFSDLVQLLLEKYLRT